MPSIESAIAAIGQDRVVHAERAWAVLHDPNAQHLAPSTIEVNMAISRMRTNLDDAVAADFLFRQEPDEDEEEEEEDENGGGNKHDENDEEDDEGYSVRKTS